jgi:Xaa-Pro aminopeptidase
MDAIPFGEERARAGAALREAGCDLAVLSSLANVTYATGVEVPVPVGAGAELTYAPWLAVLSADGECGALVLPGAANVEAGANGYACLPFDMI